MSHSVWEKIPYDEIGKKADVVFQLHDASPHLFESTTPSDKDTVRLLSLFGEMAAPGKGFLRLGILSDRQTLMELCRRILEDENVTF